MNKNIVFVIKLKIAKMKNLALNCLNKQKEHCFMTSSRQVNDKYLTLVHDKRHDNNPPIIGGCRVVVVNGGFDLINKAAAGQRGVL